MNTKFQVIVTLLAQVLHLDMGTSSGNDRDLWALELKRGSKKKGNPLKAQNVLWRLVSPGLCKLSNSE